MQSIRKQINRENREHKIIMRIVENCVESYNKAEGIKEKQRINEFAERVINAYAQTEVIERYLRIYINMRDS